MCLNNRLDLAESLRDSGKSQLKMLCQRSLESILLDVCLPQPRTWGTIKEAAQTSLELSEPVDIKTLPGLNDLWIKHDLNTEGDAAHFVNSLWLKSQTRVTQYRYSEIKRKVATWLSISNSH